MSEPQSTSTALEFYESVTGEERGLVNRAFGNPLAHMAKADPETWVEALVFLDLHRQREPDPKARASALTVGELQSWFAEKPAEGGDAAGEA
ncbi:hypothetical protein [Occultella gossypii]|uniref:Uncharacterized protein n=1 Tax=Occultella gossypii TaxID=2800820 RepID=A0ABS7SC53_9MICO|nr:hypothetical protein [Occultella gossypii]MBZ2197274.1 hypothetical protein [Occultella gossypii]